MEKKKKKKILDTSTRVDPSIRRSSLAEKDENNARRSGSINAASTESSSVSVIYIFYKIKKKYQADAWANVLFIGK